MSNNYCPLIEMGFGWPDPRSAPDPCSCGTWPNAKSHKIPLDREGSPWVWLLLGRCLERAVLRLTATSSALRNCSFQHCGAEFTLLGCHGIYLDKIRFFWGGGKSWFPHCL